MAEETRDLSPLDKIDFDRSANHPEKGKVNFPYQIQGGDEYRKIGTNERDRETERRKRAIDRLNNRAFAKRAMYGLGQTEQGDYRKANELKSEDAEQQALRRSAESERRSWNMGIKQAGDVWNKDIELMKGRQQAINDVQNGFLGASVLTQLSDLQLGYFASILNWSTDNRGILTKLVQALTQQMANSVTGQGEGKGPK